jgi:ApaG protein
MNKLDTVAFDPSLVSISVITTYLPNHSRPADSQYTFAYTITITNGGDTPVQLLSRHWVITDADNAVQEVRGEGVVGEQPIIKPGEFFRYTSGASLVTPVGCMQGSYTMAVRHPPGREADKALTFEVPIPVFSLHTPTALH